MCSSCFCARSTVAFIASSLAWHFRLCFAGLLFICATTFAYSACFPVDRRALACASDHAANCGLVAP